LHEIATQLVPKMTMLAMYYDAMRLVRKVGCEDLKGDASGCAMGGTE
jgi:hypothetical protein